MQMIFKCGEEIVNKHSDGGNIYGWRNPFQVIPEVGDFIELGEHTPEFTHLEYKPMVKYIVKSRTFSAVENYNHTYKDQKCVIELEKVN